MPLPLAAMPKLIFPSAKTRFCNDDQIPQKVGVGVRSLADLEDVSFRVPDFEKLGGAPVLDWTSRGVGTREDARGPSSGCTKIPDGGHAAV
jgi:hypothetical protein